MKIESHQLSMIQSIPAPEEEMLVRAEALLAAMWPMVSTQADMLVFRDGLIAPWVDECPGLLTNIDLYGVQKDALDYMVGCWIRTLKDPEYVDICSRLLELYP